MKLGYLLRLLFNVSEDLSVTSLKVGDSITKDGNKILRAKAGNVSWGRVEYSGADKDPYCWYIVTERFVGICKGYIVDAKTGTILREILPATIPKAA